MTTALVGDVDPLAAQQRLNAPQFVAEPCRVGREHRPVGCESGIASAKDVEEIGRGALPFAILFDQVKDRLGERAAVECGVADFFVVAGVGLYERPVGPAKRRLCCSDSPGEIGHSRPLGKLHRLIARQSGGGGVQKSGKDVRSRRLELASEVVLIAPLGLGDDRQI